MPYPFKQIFAVDPNNPSMVAADAEVLIFAPGDESRTPLVITDPSGVQLPNPVATNEHGFGPAFIALIPQVAWEGGGLTGFMESYEGLRDEAVGAGVVALAAQQAAQESAASAAGSASSAAAQVAAELGEAVAAAQQAATDAAAAAQLVEAPADSAIAAAIYGEETATAQALGARFTRRGELVINVKDFGAVGDGVADDTTALNAAIAAAAAAGASLYWPAGDYVRAGAENLTGFHNVRHTGTGRIKIGSGYYNITPQGAELNIIYTSPAGDDTNDGLNTNAPRTVQGAFNILQGLGILNGKWRVQLAAGTYGPTVATLANVVSSNRIEVRGPAVSYGVPTAVFDGGSSAGNTFGMVLTGIYALIADIKFQNYNPGSASGTGFQAQDFSDVWLDNVHAANCSFIGIYVMGESKLRLTGGIIANCQHGIRCYGNTSFSIGYNGASRRTTISNCYYGFVARDLSAGRIDYTDINACEINVWGYQGARIHPTYCTNTNAKQAGVLVSAGAWWYDDPDAPTTYSGNALNISTGAASSETAWSLFPAAVVVDAMRGTAKTHTGATAETNLETMSSVPARIMNEVGSQLVFEAVGVFAGAGTKTVRIRVNGTQIGSFVSSANAATTFTFKARMIASGGNAQVVVWEGYESGGTKVFAQKFVTAIPFAPSLLAPVVIQGTLSDAAGSIELSHAQYSYLPVSHKWL